MGVAACISLRVERHSLNTSYVLVVGFLTACHWCDSTRDLVFELPDRSAVAVGVDAVIRECPVNLFDRYQDNL